ncbi:lysosomal alpha-glucosidase isoform X1 [Silurus meridionalis]|nr:lysosomal alpha-glucosidase isoform X1 [Silurus meridionalis]
MVTPVLEPGVESVVGYVPKGLWYDFYTGDLLVSKGEEIKLHAPLDKINLHLREGVIIPTQVDHENIHTSRVLGFCVLV